MKDILKFGYLVELKDGKICMVVDTGLGEFSLIEKGGKFSSRESYYNDDLTHKYNRKLDIVSVFGHPYNPSEYFMFLKEGRDQLYKRDKVNDTDLKNMTLSEIEKELSRRVEIIFSF